jgi:hypothetical protein
MRLKLFIPASRVAESRFQSSYPPGAFFDERNSPFPVFILQGGRLEVLELLVRPPEPLMTFLQTPFPPA